MPLPEVAGDVMFGEMHSHFVPAAGTNVEFTSQGPERSLAMSSSGGGLFGRPMTRKSHGALLNFWATLPRFQPESCSLCTHSGADNPGKRSATIALLLRLSNPEGVFEQRPLSLCL